MSELAINRFESLSCGACGRRVKRKSRQQLYCSDRCRDYARRENKARTVIKNAPGYPDSGPVTNPLFLSNKNNKLQAQKSGSSIPLNVLGGYRWQNNIALDGDLMRRITRAEIGEPPELKQPIKIAERQQCWTDNSISKKYRADNGDYNAVLRPK
jgi:hypothetical protein